MSVHVWEDPSRVWQIEKWDMYWASRGMLKKKKNPPPTKKKKKKKEKRNENLTATAIESEYTAIVVSER